MTTILLIAALVLLDVFALRYGYDSRDLWRPQRYSDDA